MPIHEGSASIWHLAEVLDWLKMRGDYQIDAGVLETAKVALAVNVTKEAIRHPVGDDDRGTALVSSISHTSRLS